ncbi:hypothetical protein DIS13_08380 [Weissella paramesenteroides]|uniref:hypothetical protein n=1 Tax=Weissella paramesenteroides TaxID=1249 RepID=UPI001127608E|nr:hypothetical protein [Weissella paramesenteroides]TPF00967.1 hypothetical protein DIS13_08380 [Weissella paramesenteroides]
MAFDSRLTIQHGLAMSNDIQRELDEAELDPTTADTIRRVAGHVRYYADLEDENVLSDIEDLRSEVANIPIVDDPEDRIHDLEETVEQLQRENRYLFSKLDELETRL